MEPSVQSVINRVGGGPVELRDYTAGEGAHLKREDIFPLLSRRDLDQITAWALIYGKGMHLLFDDEGLTPLHIAAKMGAVELLEMLIDHASTINPFDSRNDKIPLISAVMAGQVCATEYLIQRGASTKYTDLQGRNALAYARLSRNTDLIVLLEPYEEKRECQPS